MNTSDIAIEAKHLTHSFKKHMALKGMSFKVKKNSIHGFVGPNGAGKTTTLKLIATLLKPQGMSKLKVFGHDVSKNYKEVRRSIGFMPDHFSMYKQMTIFEYLDFFAAAYGLKQADRDTVIHDLLLLTDMDGRKDSFIKGLSRGMQQRVNLARVLVHDPDLLLLDEPASGLDPRARIELMEMLRELKKMGKTIFISSHILSELADLCDAVTILDEGKVKYSGDIYELLKHDNDVIVNYKLKLREKNEDLEKRINDLDAVKQLDSDNSGIELRITIDNTPASSNMIFKCIIDSNAEVISFAEEMKHLNQAFMDLTTAGVRSK